MQEKVRKPLLAAPQLFDQCFSAHHYAQSPSGVDSNLLLLLHGLGDNDMGFFNLGKNLQKTLPQTAVLTLQAPYAVPFLDQGQHWMWYPSFDQFGELLTKPNPTTTVRNVVKVLEHLVGTCGWSPANIHLFGFGQGATIALETLVEWSKTKPKPSTNTQQPGSSSASASASSSSSLLGSIVSVSGQLISHPTLDASSTSTTTTTTSTPVLQIYRSNQPIPKDSARWASHRKAAGGSLTLHRLGLTADGRDEDMLRGSEWDAVMSFWSKFLRNRSTWELDGKVTPLS